MADADRRRLAHLAPDPQHRVVEDEVEEIVPAGGDGRADHGDDADIVHRLFEDERAERRDEKKSDDLERKRVADAVLGGAHGAPPIWFRAVPVKRP